MFAPHLREPEAPYRVKECDFSFSAISVPAVLVTGHIYILLPGKCNLKQLGCKLLTFTKLDYVLCESGIETEHTAVANDEQYLT